MQVKFNKRLEEYDYILSFDLAKHITGYSLMEIETNKILVSGLVETDSSNGTPWKEFYDKVKETIVFLREKYGNNFFVLKERLPNQNGPRSSIAALQELAKVHAIFDLLVDQMYLDYYDFLGVSSVSEKAIVRSYTGIEKPTKDDVFNFVVSVCPNFEPILINEKKKIYDTNTSDSIMVSLTLILKKWNSDIEAEIKELRKKTKLYKRERDVSLAEEKIGYLQNLKIKKEVELCGKADKL